MYIESIPAIIAPLIRAQGIAPLQQRTGDEPASDQPLAESRRAGAPAEAEPVQSELGEIIGQLGKELEQFDIALKFSRDAETGTTVLEMINERTGEIIRQMPSDTSLRLASALGKLQSHIFSRTA